MSRRSQTPMKQTGIYLPVSLYDKLVAEADRLALPISTITRLRLERSYQEHPAVTLGLEDTE